MEYILTLKYQLIDHSCDLDALADRLAEAGCEDALIGFGQLGRVALEFSREADSVGNAIRSALSDVQRAIPSAKLAACINCCVAARQLATTEHS